MMSSVTVPRVMLSGFENKSEKNDAIRIIWKLHGKYIINQKNSQAFMKDCTHVICAKPSRREKYLAACAAGKWILSPQYLTDCEKANKWLQEVEYQWSNAPLSGADPQTKDLYQAPERWRTAIVTKGDNPPFIGWHVGLVMQSHFAEAFIRIVEAGGGRAFDITLSYIESSKPFEEVNEELLTHILVTPALKSKVKRRRCLEGIPHLGSDYLSLLLLCKNPPDLMEHSIFKDEDCSRLTTTSSVLTGPIPRKVFNIGEGTVGVTPSPEKAVPGSSGLLLNQSIGSGPPGNGKNVAKPLPASLISKNALVIPGGSASVLHSTSKKSNTPSKSKLPSAKTFETAGQPAKKLKLSPKKQSQVHVNPVILLGSQRKKISIPKSKAEKSTEPKARRTSKLYSKEFLQRNGGLMKECISKKKRLMTYEGILDAVVNPIRYEANRERTQCPKPFSQDTIATLEGALEMSYGHDFFLSAVKIHCDVNVYPPPEVLYILMKVLLLDSERYAFSVSAYHVLEGILRFHPTQAKHVKSEKLYHKAFAAITMPDVNESSSLVMAIGERLSRVNDKDWKVWTVRDQSLGVHWSFYSRVLNIATQQIRLSEANSTLPMKFRNAALLTTFLSDLVVSDYQDVIKRNIHPSHSPMIKCLIADLLWPTMTGLEPWFRRPSTNLTDLASLYVKAVENFVFWKRENASDVNGDTLLGDGYAVMRDISRILSVTASWCIRCDLTDKQRGKRTSTRTLEYELVSVLSSGLSDKNFDVVQEALRHLPYRTKLKVNIVLIQNNSSHDLIEEDVLQHGELSLFGIASCLMKVFPSYQLEEKHQNCADNSRSNDPSLKSDSNKSESCKGSEVGGLKRVQRNKKGETPLHQACAQNRPDRVRYLLNQPGIEPNAIDYGGWTSLALACKHGHSECVEVLLSLPLKPIAADSKMICDSSAWEIDLTLCPSNGRTPLHSALAIGHFEIACMLLKKGGVKLIDIKDAHNQTPLDYCENGAVETSILQFACNIAANVQKNERGTEDSVRMELLPLPSLETYEKVLPRRIVLLSHSWRDKVLWLNQVVCLLISNFLVFSETLLVCDGIHSQNECNPTDIDVISPELESYATDLMYCCRWRECWSSYSNHICRLLGGDEENISYILSRCKTPVPQDMCVDQNIN